MDYNTLRKLAYDTILNLATDEGINASGKDDVYGCIFGRDSAITILKILNVIGQSSDLTDEERTILTAICRRALLTLVKLQGTESNIESGEQPGKFIHEYRPNNYKRLLTLDTKPWYIYPDGVLRNYDSLDSTPLALIAIYKYWQITGDNEFLLKALSGVEAGLNWIITYGDLDKDALLEYELPNERKHGGLVVQSWTDSHESVRQKDGKMPCYPIAPVEVQGYAWLALKLWADFYASSPLNSSDTSRFAQLLSLQSDSLKKQFNEVFFFTDAYSGLRFAAQALDGNKNQMRTVTGNPMLLLWATYERKLKVKRECIVEDEYISNIVSRAFMPDLFDADAGIRTMSTFSPTFNPGRNSYHNGSFWPKLNGMTHEGLIHWEYAAEAEQLKYATLKPFIYFESMIELYMKDEKGTFLEYQDPNGQVGCRQQAWSAAAALNLLAV